jgi:hypothetical protein
MATLARPAISLWWTVANPSSHIAISAAICVAIGVHDAAVVRTRGLTLEDGCLFESWDLVLDTGGKIWVRSTYSGFGGAGSGG